MNTTLVVGDDGVLTFPEEFLQETGWKDGEGRILPDAFVVPNNIEAKQLASKVHSDLGDGFIKAVDGRSRRVVGADHECSDSDVIKIHAKS